MRHPRKVQVYQSPLPPPPPPRGRHWRGVGRRGAGWKGGEMAGGMPRPARHSHQAAAGFCARRLQGLSLCRPRLAGLCRTRPVSRARPVSDHTLGQKNASTCFNEGIPWESGAFSAPPGGAYIRIPSARGSSQGYGRGVACRIPPSAITPCDAGRPSTAATRPPGVTAALATFRILHSPPPHVMRPMPLYLSPPAVTGMQSAFAPRQREALARGPAARIDAAAGGAARSPASCAGAAEGQPAPRGRSKPIASRADLNPAERPERSREAWQYAQGHPPPPRTSPRPWFMEHSCTPFQPPFLASKWIMPICMFLQNWSAAAGPGRSMALNRPALRAKTAHPAAAARLASTVWRHTARLLTACRYGLCSYIGV